MCVFPVEYVLHYVHNSWSLCPVSTVAGCSRWFMSWGDWTVGWSVGRPAVSCHDPHPPLVHPGVSRLSHAWCMSSDQAELLNPDLRVMRNLLCVWRNGNVWSITWALCSVYTALLLCVFTLITAENDIELYNTPLAISLQSVQRAAMRRINTPVYLIIMC